MTKIVLHYNLKPNDQQTIAAILTPLGIEFIQLSDEDCQQEVGALAKLTGYERTPQTQKCNHFKEEFIFMCNLCENEMNEMSQQMKAKGINFKGIRAILTQHNKDWRLIDLFDEVMADHEMFNLIDELQKLIKMSNVFHKDDFSLELWQPYEQALMDSYMYLQKRDFNLESLNRNITKLKLAMDALHSLNN